MALSKSIYFVTDENGLFHAIKPLRTTLDKIGGIFCHICNEIYGSKKDFESHYVMHSPRNSKIVYTCIICKKEMSNYPSFRSHCYLNHVMKNKFQCKQCEKSFCKLCILKSHIAKVHTYKCPSCNEKFTSKNEFYNHKNTHSMKISIKERPPYDCITCGINLKSVDMCESHFEEHSTILYPCPICSEVLANKTDATKHLAVHFDFNENIPDDLSQTTPSTNSSINMLGGILCYYCNELFRNRTEIDAHFETDHDDKIVLYTCNICGKQYEKYLMFGDHCHSHISKDKFQCDQCDRAFPRVSLLVIHTEAFHINCTRDKPFVCELCDHGFMTRFRLLHHIRIVHDEKPTIRCLIPGCSATFENPKDLILHEKSHKSLDTWCRQCGLQFVSLTAASRHLDVHRRPKYPCPVCTKAYAEKRLLLKHVTTHFAATLHVCQLCGQSFSRASRLGDHLKRHSDIRTYHCTYCPKTFLKPHELKQHINVHTGLRPYRCPICYKDITNNPNWRKHLAKVHGLDKAVIDKMKAERDAHLTSQENSETSNASETPKIFEHYDDERCEISFETSDAPDLNTICDPISGERVSVSDTVNAAIERIDSLDDELNESSTTKSVFDCGENSNNGTVLEDMSEASEIQAIVEHIESMSKELEMIDDMAPTNVVGLHADAQNLQFAQMTPMKSSVLDNISDNIQHPDSLLYPSTEAQYTVYPTGSLAELTSLDDHMLPHIDPLLTIKTMDEAKVYVQDDPSLVNAKLSMQNLTPITPKTEQSIMHLQNGFPLYYTNPMTLDKQGWEPIITKVFCTTEANDLNRMFIC